MQWWHFTISNFNPYQDEWVISRVFQKSCSGAAIGGSGSGSAPKKNRFNTTINLYTEASSPSSVSLPPLLDATTTLTTAASTTTLNDRDSCSYDSHTQHEHVSCFSTIAAAASAAAKHNSNNFDLAPLPPPPMTDSFSRFPRNTGANGFPSLRSLQENLQLPFFFSSPPSAAVVPPFHGGGAAMNWMVNPEEGRFDGTGAGIGAGGRVAMGPTELDCMWTCWVWKGICAPLVCELLNYLPSLFFNDSLVLFRFLYYSGFWLCQLDWD